MGDVPDWYLHLRAARYLRVPPWELSDAPLFWRNAALTAEDAEATAQQQHSQPQSGA